MSPPLITRNFITLLGAVYGSLFYGVYLITLGLYIHSLLAYKFKHHRGTNRRFQKSILQPFSVLLLSAVVLLAVVMTTEMVNSVVYSVYFLAIYSTTDETRLLPQSVHLWSTFISIVNILISTFLADSILIYRCWVIYGHKRRVIIFPLFTTLVGLGCFAAVVPLTIQSSMDTPGIDTIGITPALRATGATAWFSTILTNLVTTSLIVWRLRTASSRSSTADTSTRSSNSNALSLPSSSQNDVIPKLHRVARVVAESGLVLTTSTTIVGIVYLSNATYVNCIGSGTVQIVGIAFNLVAYRVSKEQNTSSVTPAIPNTPQSPLSPNPHHSMTTMQFHSTSTPLETSAPPANEKSVLSNV